MRGTNQCCRFGFIESVSGYGSRPSMSREFGSGYEYRSGIGSGSRSRVLAEKIIFFWSKIAIYLSLGLLKGRPSYRKSLQPSKEIIQYLKKWNLLTFPYICHFSRSNPDPEPQHWYQQSKVIDQQNGCMYWLGSATITECSIFATMWSISVQQF